MSRRDVLLVEDDERNAALIRLALEPAGYGVTWAHSVAEARLTLEEYLPPVILLDLRLPDEPGYVLAREVRAMPGGEGVLILAVSASVLEANRRQAIEAGCDDFIEKPISPRDVLARVRNAVEARV
jgi:DNA-binding response OmpR family regulator